MSSAKTPIPIKAIDFDQAQRVVEDFSRIRNVPSVTFPQSLPASDAAGKGDAPQVPTPLKAEKPKRQK